MTTVKTKSFITIIAGILAVLILASFASATLTISNIPTLKQDESQFTFDITSNETETVQVSVSSISQDGNTITFGTDSLSLDDDTKTSTITYTIPSGFDFRLGKSYSTTITINGSVSGEKTATVSFESTDYCEYDDFGNLDIEITDIKTISGFGDDDDYWYPGDEVEIEVEISYNGDDNDDEVDVDLEWALYTSDGREVLEDEEESVKIDDGDEETITFRFVIDPDELDSSETDYILFVRVVGDEERDAGDRNICASDSDSIEVKIDNDFVVVKNIEFSPEVGSCGNVVRVTGEVWNIGDDDQEDVYVLIYNPDLFETKTIEIGDIDSFENEEFSFEFEIPKGLDEKTHIIEFRVYDEDDDLFENDEDDVSKTNFYYKIENCALSPEATISANLKEGGKAGKELVIEATITNIGDEIGTYNIIVSGYESWASSAQLSKSIAVIGAGQSDTFTVTLDTNSGSEGEQTFLIELVAAITSQPVSVSLEKGGFSFPMTGNFFSEDNWYLWGIGALNIILVIIIIIVAIRIARA